MTELIVLILVGLLVWRLVVRARAYDWNRMRPVAHFFRLTVWEDVRHTKNRARENRAARKFRKDLDR